MKRMAFFLCALVVVFPPAHAAGPGVGGHTQSGDTVDNRTPEERMKARFPQKVRVGDLIGLPIQDYNDRILGHVADVTRTAEGKIVLVMLERGWFGFSGRSVSIPIETVAILARHINLLDIPREDVAKLPTLAGAAGRSIDRAEIIRIAIGRR